MDKDAILVALTDIFRDVLDDDSLVLTRETTAEDVPDWDSANHINIIVAAEMRFRVKCNSAEVESLHNVGDFVDLVARKLAARG